MEAKTETIEVIPDGAECYGCGRVVKGRAVIWHVQRDPETGKQRRVKPHPKPKRYFNCPCGRKWSKRILKSSLVRRLNNPPESTSHP